LPANTALAVNKDVAYVEVKQGDEILIVAKDLVENVFTDEKHQPLDYKILRELKGHELVGLSYEPLIAIPEGMSYTSIGKKDTKAGDSTEQTAALVSDMYKVQSADYVETDAGTGIVHIAPTYGEEDYDLAKRNNFPGLHVIDTNGFYFEPMAKKLLALMPWRDVAAPLNVWESNKDVAKALKSAGIVWKIDYITHSYPHCHRCGTKLMYRAHPSWYRWAAYEDAREERTNQLVPDTC
jgi:isoleucyl-tRNA synthetase